jgi:hypothetical protein
MGVSCAGTSRWLDGPCRQHRQPIRSERAACQSSSINPLSLAADTTAGDSLEFKQHKTSEAYDNQSVQLILIGTR